MTRIVGSLALLTAALALSLPAQAASLTRTFVSSAGVDSNPCTTAQPCATFAAAYAAVISGGIVAALDPGKYGPLTITGPVTVDGNGWAAITTPPSPGRSNIGGITINAGSTDNVVLRGLTIDGVQAGFIGIRFNTGGSLTIDGCVVRNTPGSALSFTPNGGANETLTVSNSSFINSGGSGIEFSVNTGSVTASIDRSDVSNNGDAGLIASIDNGASVHVSFSNSVAANNTNFGLYAAGDGTGIVSFTVTDTLVLGNAVGVETLTANNTIWLAHSTIAGNTTGYEISGGTINSFGDNYIIDTNNTGSLTPAGPQ